METADYMNSEAVLRYQGRRALRSRIRAEQRWIRIKAGAIIVAKGLFLIATAANIAYAIVVTLTGD